MTKPEQMFLTRLTKTFEEYGVFFHKIADMPYTPGLSGFDLKKPFDAFAVAESVPIAIEAKYIPKYQAFGLNALRDNQIEGLDRFERAGGKGYIFLNVRQKYDARVGTKRLNRLLIFPWEVFRRRTETYKKKELEEWPYTDLRHGLYIEGVGKFLQEEADKW